MGSELPASDLRVDFDAEASDAREATFVEEAGEISKVPPVVYVRIKAIVRPTVPERARVSRFKGEDMLVKRPPLIPRPVDSS